MFGLCLIQVLVLGVLCATVRTSVLPCYDEGELEERAQRKLRHIYTQLSEPENLELSTSERKCPVGRYAGLGKEIKDRSISPWRLVSDTKEDRYPRTLAVAQCLCDGCITIRRQDNEPMLDFTFNSHPIVQSRVVLMKTLCNRPDDHPSNHTKYSLVAHTVNVAVGCTCLKPRVVD